MYIWYLPVHASFLLTFFHINTMPIYSKRARQQVQGVTCYIYTQRKFCMHVPTSLRYSHLLFHFFLRLCQRTEGCTSVGIHPSLVGWCLRCRNATYLRRYALGQPGRKREGGGGGFRLQRNDLGQRFRLRATARFECEILALVDCMRWEFHLSSPTITPPARAVKRF